MSEESNVVPLYGNAAFREAQGLGARLRLELEALTNLYADDMAAYVVVVVDTTGRFNVVWKIDEHPVMGPTMLAGLAKEAITRDITADRAAIDAIERNFGPKP